MQARVVAGLVALALVGGCRSADIDTTEPQPTVQPAPPPLTADALPAGSTLEVELTETLSTESSEVGDRFSARVKQALVARNGEVIVPMGAMVHGTVTGVDDSDHPGDQAAIRLNFERLEIGSRSHAFAANVLDADVEFESERDVEDVAEKAGIAAVAGAVLGVIIGGDLEDALIGGALGAGAGTIISLGTGDVEAALPRGSDLTLMTTQTVNLR